MKKKKYEEEKKGINDTKWNEMNAQFRYPAVAEAIESTSASASVAEVWRRRKKRKSEKKERTKELEYVKRSEYVIEELSEW